MATTIKLDPEIELRLSRAADRAGLTKAQLLQKIVTDGLYDLEDHLLAKATMERVRRGEETIHPADAVRRSLGLDD